MKKINKSHIFSFILGAIIFSGITGVLAYKLAANQVSFTPSDSTWQVSDVDNALDSLFDMATYGNASASDIVSGKTALVNGAQVTGNLTVPSYQTLANTENVSAGSSSSARTGYYYLNNYKVTCGTTTCPSYTSLSGTQNVSAGSSSTTLNGYYNLSNYKVSCGTNSCPACNSCCNGLSDGTNLYTNPSPTSAFSEGTITLNGYMNNYTFIEFVYYVSTTRQSAAETASVIVKYSDFVNFTGDYRPRVGLNANIIANDSSGNSGHWNWTRVVTYVSNNQISISNPGITSNNDITSNKKLIILYKVNGYR